MSFTSEQLSGDDWEQRVGEQFRALRLRSGFDQAGLAEASGVSLGAVKNLEHGKGSTLKTLVKVARSLDRSEWLLEIAPPVTVSPIEILRSGRQRQRNRVYRPRGGNS
ncbi:helix-turn-helix transcriptional regulator [Glaciihabitans sp. UYNi722]|uniref:helix-turn-helix domain-containing protein n=1 Tax=Glaciihabitans sp. UYNi722 TaxID=3156344 RepID=UPI003395F3F0